MHGFPDRFAVLFDLDGTLVDSLDDLHASVNEALAAHELPFRSREEIQSYIGEGARELIERAAAPVAESVRIDEIFATYRAAYSRNLVNRTRLYPGVYALLDDLRAARISLGIATNKTVAPAGRILSALGVRGFFQQVIGGDTFPERKPHPIAVRAFAAHCGLPVNRIVFAGDHWTDIAAGQAAGARTVFFPNRIGRLNGLCPHAWAKDARAFAALLQRPGFLAPGV